MYFSHIHQFCSIFTAVSGPFYYLLISEVCSFSVCYCMTLFEANHIELPEEKEEEREEGKKYTNLNDFLK